MLKTVLAQVATNITDPLGNRITNLSQIFAFILNLILGAGFSLVLIFLAMGFLQYVMSQGDKAGIEKAQKWVTYAVIGGLGLFLVIAFKGIMGQIVGGNIANTVGENANITL
jgi:hypothetical protein